MTRLSPRGSFCRSLVGWLSAGCLASVSILCDVVAAAEVWAVRAREMDSSIQLIHYNCEPDEMLEEALTSSRAPAPPRDRTDVAIKRRTRLVRLERAKFRHTRPPTARYLV